MSRLLASGHSCTAQEMLGEGGGHTTLPAQAIGTL
jgi:hypothetical protein